MIYQIIKNEITGTYYVYSECEKVKVTKQISKAMKQFMDKDNTIKGVDGDSTVWFRKR